MLLSSPIAKRSDKASASRVSFTGLVIAQSGGMFAGGGAVYSSSSGDGNFIAGDGGVGAGGGLGLGSNNSVYGRSGRGGDGIIFIAVKEYT